MEARKLSQLERLFSMLWNRDNLEVRKKIEDLHFKKISCEDVAQKLFDAIAEESLLQFLELVEKNDQWGMLIIEDVKNHTLTTSQAAEDAKDLMTVYKKK